MPINVSVEIKVILHRIKKLRPLRLKIGLKNSNGFFGFFAGLKRYKMLSLIGDGTYGLVYLATNIETSEKVAIKVWNMEGQSISVALVIKSQLSLSWGHSLLLLKSSKNLY